MFIHSFHHPYPHLQVNSNPVRKEGSKTAATGGGAERSSSSKPTSGKLEEKTNT